MFSKSHQFLRGNIEKNRDMFIGFGVGRWRFSKPVQVWGGGGYLNLENDSFRAEIEMIVEQGIRVTVLNPPLIWEN